MTTMTTTFEQRDRVDVCPVHFPRIDAVPGRSAWRVAGVDASVLLMAPAKPIRDKYTGVIVPERRGVT